MTDEKLVRKKVAVIMSSYNGDRYIEEQIGSILEQTGVDVTLYIRDDGSTDGTCRILQEYSRKKHVMIQYGRNIGIGNSFMELLWSVPDTFDYYAFSDQDDVWEPDKLLTAVDALRAVSGCALYASNLECVDADNNPIGMLFEPDLAYNDSLLSVICRGGYYGCTQVFNKKLFLLLQQNKPSEQLLAARCHDDWVSCSAAACGTIVFDMKSHIKYRRHGNNYSSLNLCDTAFWKRKFSKVVHSERRNPKSKTAKEVVRLYPERTRTDKDAELIYTLAYPRKFTNKIALIKNRKKYLSSTKEPDAWFVFKVLAGLI